MGEVRVYGAPSEMAGKWIREADQEIIERLKASGEWSSMPIAMPQEPDNV